MLGSLGMFVKFSFLIAVALVFFIASAVYAINVVSRAVTTGVVRVGRIPDLSNSAVDRAPYLLARAEELSAPVALDGLYEVKVPPLATRFGAKDDLKFLDDVKINIEGINLPDTIKKLFAALPDDEPIVSAEAEPVTAGSAARLEWKEPSGKRKTWPLRSVNSGADGTRDIIDQAIYRMVYYMHYDPTKPGPRPKGVQFPSERALESYYAGQQSLGSYQRKRGSQQEIKAGLDDLKEAEKRFRVLYQEMPNFTDGLMLLGVTLLEQKNEPEAIVIFDRIKTNLLQDGRARYAQAHQAQAQNVTEQNALTQLKAEEKKAFFSAKLFWATAQRKLYRVRNNHLALAELESIIPQVTPLHAALPPNATDEQKADRLDFQKIHISVLAEEAYVLGAYLILFNEVNFIAGLKTQPAQAGQPAPVNPPQLVALTANRRAIIDPIEARINAGGADVEQAKGDRLAQYRVEMENIYQQHETAVTNAKNLINNHGTNDDAWKGISARFLSDLDNAHGYAQYRRAQVVEDVRDDDQAFLTKCTAALDTLHQAYAVHQYEQTILLNLGLIESDPRCDPKGVNIERARTYLKQAAEMKPTDYYAQQLLATLGIREMYTWGPFAKPEVLTDAITAAENARTLRPEAGTIWALLAQAYVLKWAQSDATQGRPHEDRCRDRAGREARCNTSPSQHGSAAMARKSDSASARRPVRRPQGKAR